MQLFKGLGVMAIAAVAIFTSPATAAAQDPFLGYVEGEFVWVGLPEGGTLDELTVRRGDQADKGAVLFRLDDTRESAAVTRARANAAEAAARVQNLLKGMRPTEINALEARIAQAEADRTLARLNLARQEDLAETGAASAEARDAARAAHQRAAARVEELQQELQTARLPAREDEIAAARAALSAAEAALDEAAWQLSQRTGIASQTGLVFDTFFRVGEFVKAGQPVVSLLPPENIKVRFYVPQSVAGEIRSGDHVTVTCDGCPAPVAATVRYVAPEAEFTPPVIYSESARQKLVFLVEAWPDDLSAALHPGLPVEVRLSR